MARGLGIACGIVAALVASSAARAQPPAVTPTASLLDRPHTVAELEIGGIALPTAPISPGNRGGNLTPILAGPFLLPVFAKGDATLQVSLHLLYRPTRDFAFGADGLISPAPSTATDTFKLSSGQLVDRSHSRNYLMLGAEGRYYPIRYRWIEGWLGLTASIVIIADRFESPGVQDTPTILGRKEVTQRTEGFSYGVQAGADYLITDSITIGLSLRANRWLLPLEGGDPRNDAACSSIGNCPTVTGTVEAFEFGVKVGYRIPL